MKRSTFLLTLFLLPSLSTFAKAKDEKNEQSLFENVANVLAERYFDEHFRENELPQIIERYRKRIAKAENFNQHRDVVQEFLTNMPSTHTALIQTETFDGMHKTLGTTPYPTFGFESIEYDGKQYAFNVLEKGPADVAGLRRGDRIVLIDGVLANDSPRLGWRTDDAFLPDPPLRPVLGKEGDAMKLKIERTPGKYRDLEITCKPYSAWEAAKASVRVVEQNGKRIGVIHFWLIHMSGPDELLKESLEGELASCDALVLDLRGRGGNGFMVSRMLDVLDGTTSSWNKPVVGLINQHSRSAKEVIAHEFKKLEIGSLVGERTAGAVIPVTMADVGFGMSLMFPSFTLPKHTDILEFKGVAPDVVVEEVGPYSAGADPIFDAGVQEAVRLSNVSPEKFAARRAKASKENPRHRGQLRHATAQRKSNTKKHKRTLPKEPDVPGYDPEAMDVWAKMIDAMGGEKTFRRHQYRSVKGKRRMGGMMNATIERLAAAPNKRIDRMTLEGMGGIERGYNGDIGWEVSRQNGTKKMDDEELATYMAQADFYADLNPRKHHKSIVYVGPMMFNDKLCHELRMTRNSGDVDTHYIDSATYRPIGWIGNVNTNMGPMEMIQVNEKFESFDGELIAVSTNADVGGMQNMVTTITEVSFDKLPPETFDPPKKLLEN